MVAALLQEFLHDVFTDNIGENSKPHAEARTHANDKEIVMCVPVVATSELRRVLQDEQEHDGTTILRSSDLCPELTEEFPQHKVRGCYSIRFSSSPASTNWICTTCCISYSSAKMKHQHKLGLKSRPPLLPDLVMVIRSPCLLASGISNWIQRSSQMRSLLSAV